MFIDSWARPHLFWKIQGWDSSKYVMLPNIKLSSDALLWTEGMTVAAKVGFTHIFCWCWHLLDKFATGRSNTRCFEEQESALPFLSGGSCCTELSCRVVYPRRFLFFLLSFCCVLIAVVLWAKIEFKDSKLQARLGIRLMKQLQSFFHRLEFSRFAQGSEGKLVY